MAVQSAYPGYDGTLPAPARFVGLDEAQITKLFNHFVAYSEAVYKWQQQVTNDIREIKGALNLGAGNPDDPPPPPWGPKNGG